MEAHVGEYHVLKIDKFHLYLPVALIFIDHLTNWHQFFMYLSCY